MRDEDYTKIKSAYKAAIKNKDFPQAAYYSELLSGDYAAAVSWDRFKGSWAVEQWLKSKKTQDLIKSLEADNQRFGWLRESDRDKLKQFIRKCISEAVEEPLYVEYHKQMKGEVPFMMGDRKFEYVWAKYPNGKIDIGVYSFSEDLVLNYSTFRKQYNLDKTLKESDGDTKVYTSFFVNRVNLNRLSKDPDAERDDVFQVVKVTTDSGGDDYHEDVVGDYHDESQANKVAFELNRRLKENPHIAQQIQESKKETFYKGIMGTVNVDGVDYDYSANVEINVVVTNQPHGEEYAEIDPSDVSFEITDINPKPENDLSRRKIEDEVYDDVHSKNYWEYVNESDEVENSDVVKEIQNFTMPKPEPKPEKTINITGKKCVKCKKGKYGEMSIHNDIEGTKTCNSCGHTLPTNATKDDLLEERSSDKRATVIFDIKMDNFFEENAIYKANDMVFQAIQSTIGDMLRNTYKVTNIEKEGEFRYFTFEVKLEDKKYIKPMIDALSQEYHVKKLSITKIF